MTVILQRILVLNAIILAFYAIRILTSILRSAGGWRLAAFAVVELSVYAIRSTDF